MKKIIVLIIILLVTGGKIKAQNSCNFEKMSAFMKHENMQNGKCDSLISFEISSHSQKTFEILLNQGIDFKISLMGSSRYKNSILLDIYKNKTLVHKIEDSSLDNKSSTIHFKTDSNIKPMKYILKFRFNDKKPGCAKAILYSKNNKIK